MDFIPRTCRFCASPQSLFLDKPPNALTPEKGIEYDIQTTISNLPNSLSEKVLADFQEWQKPKGLLNPAIYYLSSVGQVLTAVNKKNPGRSHLTRILGSLLSMFSVLVGLQVLRLEGIARMALKAGLKQSVDNWSNQILGLLGVSLNEATYFARVREVDAAFTKSVGLKTRNILLKKERHTQIEKLFNAEGLQKFRDLHKELKLDLSKVSKCTRSGLAMHL